MREQAPVYREPNTGIFLISSFAAVSQVLRDWERFSNRFARAMGGLGEPPPEVLEVAKDGYPPVDTMLTADPPEQKRFRKLVNKAFSAKRVETLEARVEEIANELVDRIESRGRAELLARVRAAAAAHGDRRAARRAARGPRAASASGRTASWRSSRAWRASPARSRPRG